MQAFYQECGEHECSRRRQGWNKLNTASCSLPTNWEAFRRLHQKSLREEVEENQCFSRSTSRPFRWFSIRAVALDAQRRRLLFLHRGREQQVKPDSCPGWPHHPKANSTGRRHPRIRFPSMMALRSPEPPSFSTFGEAGPTASSSGHSHHRSDVSGRRGGSFPSQTPPLLLRFWLRVRAHTSTMGNGKEQYVESNGMGRAGRLCDADG